MAKRETTRKRSKNADRWVTANAPRPRTGYECARCGADIGSPANLPDHHDAAHLGR